MNLHPRHYYNPVAQKNRRYAKICELVDLKDTDRVLNVGCGEGLTFENFNSTNHIVGVDLFPESKIKRENFEYKQISGNGELPFKDKEFDVVVCIGVLEHVHPEEALRKTCEEIVRVGKRYLILVPDYWTLIEPHYAFPMFQHLPVFIQKFLHNILNLRLELKNGKDNPYEYINYYPTKKWLSFFPKEAKYIIHKHISFLITNLMIYGENKN